MTPLKEVFKTDTPKCEGVSYYSVKDEMDIGFKFESTDMFVTKWHIIDDSKYKSYGEDWFSNLQFKNEIIILSVIAVVILSSLLFYIWYQRKRSIKYMKIVPDVDI